VSGLILAATAIAAVASEMVASRRLPVNPKRKLLFLVPKRSSVLHSRAVRAQEVARHTVVGKKVEAHQQLESLQQNLSAGGDISSA
jgi:hypothetical protein